MSATFSPILHTPYETPKYHWMLNEHTLRAEGIMVNGRRPSGDCLPVPKHRHNGTLLLVDTAKQVPPHSMINEIRDYVGKWRDDGWIGANRVTSELLEHWRDGMAEPRPFFCQVEAIETLVWLHEAGKRAAPKEWMRITKMLGRINEAQNEGINRMAIRMAPGTGKPRLMQMLVSWVATNKTHDADFLVLASGPSAKEQLDEIKPVADGAYNSVLPRHLHDRIFHARVHVINVQSFQRRGKIVVDKEGKETGLEMLQRLLQSMRRRRLTVLNYKPHSCISTSTRQWHQDENHENLFFGSGGTHWFNVLRTLKKFNLLEQVYDFSATPMYHRARTDLPSYLFPWTVTDYPLIEAVEAGLTKIPRVFQSDESKFIYRGIFRHARTPQLDLRNIPTVVKELLEQIHKHYSATTEKFSDVENTKPAVMVVVANSAQSATTLYAHIAGYHDGNKWNRGNLRHFSNILPDGSGPLRNPPTLLVQSGIGGKKLPTHLENISSGAVGIHTPGIVDKKAQMEQIGRIFRTAGRKCTPGEHIRCIVSGSLLPEGWDAKAVTHIFLYRKIVTRPQCERAIGWGLHRSGFDNQDEIGILPPEYVTISGLPMFELAPRPSNPRNMIHHK